MKTFMVIARSAVLRMINVTGKVVEKSKAHILCPINLFLTIVPFIRQCGKVW